MTYQDQEATGSISANFSRVSKTAIPNRYITSPSPDGASHEVTHQACAPTTMFRIIIPDNPQELMMKQTLIAFALTVVTVAPAMADQALATSKNCMACQDRTSTRLNSSHLVISYA